MNSFHIAVLPGDGIGIEVMTEAVQVLDAVTSRLEGVRFDLTEHGVGAAEYVRHGDPLPAAAFEACRAADAVLLGAMGLPDVRWPDGRELTPQIDLRERLDLYAGLRPIRLYHANDTPLKRRVAGEIDLLLVRESTEGLFSARLSRADAQGEAVSDVLRVTRKGADRVCRVAFEQARRRRRKCVLVDKANVLPSMVFFRSVFDSVALEYPDVEAGHVYVDAMALYLVQKPHAFDVLVTENMFGDILSDLAAGLVGGMGMAPSADLGDDCAVFQPAHGSAPDIAGRGIANPVATILSVAMMLEWLEHPETVRGALLIRNAVETVLADPRNRTSDLGGRLSTSEMGELIRARIPADGRSIGNSDVAPCPVNVGRLDNPSALQFHDLTLTLREGMPGVAWETARTIERDGWNARTLHLYSHAGTHMDAQVHFEAGLETIDKLGIERCLGPAWIVDCGTVQPRQLLEVDILGPIASRVQPGDALLFRTGWSRYVEDPARYRDELPRISEALARWCVERRVKLLGVEAPSVADVHNREEVTRIHRILLEGGVTIIEGLTNLESICADKVQFVALPLKIEGGDGSPVRAFAIEDIPYEYRP
jgi:3-isopropylmalate dehydrogenase